MQPAWILLFFLSGVNAAAGVVEVDLVFPRNETYVPTSTFPIIIAFQNSGLAPFLNPQIYVDIMNLDDDRGHAKSPSYDMRWANFSSSDPYHKLRVLNFDKEGRWALAWEVSWDGCTEESLATSSGYKNIMHNKTRRAMIFTTRNAAQEVDLVSATNNRNFSEDQGVAISVTTTLPGPELYKWDHNNGNGICASLASTTPAPILAK
jgi:hypothetical protein